MDLLAKNNDSSKNQAANNVKQRLIDVAEDLFAEKGYESTSVRDLTAKANCNIAAINYHFGGKDNLYLEVFSRRMAALRDIRISSIDNVMSQSDVTLEELLRTFANAFIEPLIKDSSGRRFMKLMTREMVNPKLPKEVFLEKTIIPVMGSLQNALLKVCPQLTKEKAVMAIFSIVGQLIHIIRIEDMFGDIENEQFPALDLADAVNHVVEFSAAGIKGMIEIK